MLFVKKGSSKSSLGSQKISSAHQPPEPKLTSAEIWLGLNLVLGPIGQLI